MREQLSSDLTLPYKYLLAPACMVVFFFLTIKQFGPPSQLHQRGYPSVHPDLFFLFIWPAGIVLLYWAFGRLKKVELEGSSLFISNFFKSIEIPLRDVEGVSGSILLSPELVWIRFRRPTEFGDKIIFMGKWRFFCGWTRHPVVRRLQNFVAESEDAY